jgi:hypothetical protein
MTILSGLVIDEPWVSMITSGEKTWEMRSGNTLAQGRIALIRKGWGTVLGMADLIGTLSMLSRAELSIVSTRAPSAIISNIRLPGYSSVLNLLPQAVPYRHPRVTSYGLISIRRWLMRSKLN